jgi:hypothetical protein
VPVIERGKKRGIGKDEEDGGGVEELPLNVARRHKRKGGVGATDGWLTRWGEGIHRRYRRSILMHKGWWIGEAKPDVAIACISF